MNGKNCNNNRVQNRFPAIYENYWTLFSESENFRIYISENSKGGVGLKYICTQNWNIHERKIYRY